MKLNQITIYITDIELNVIDTIAERMELSRSATAKRMLSDFMKVLQEQGVLSETLELNDRIIKPVKKSFRD